MIPSERDQTILNLNQTVLECVLRGDWQEYAAHCDPTVSCFEAETNGHLVEGLDFHRFYFPAASPASSSHPSTSSQAGTSSEQSSKVSEQEQPEAQVTMARPHLRWLSDESVVLSYTRLVQRRSNGDFITSSCCETRIWQRQGGSWKQVHVHRS